MEKESQENINNPKIIDNNMNLNVKGFNYWNIGIAHWNIQ
jgi:hypothetical protein